MRAKAACLALAMLLGVGVADARPGTATKYRPANMLGGYSDKEIEPGLWRIKARANGIAEPGFAQNMAIYRAAELLDARGFSHMQVVDQKGKSMSMGFGGASPSYAGGDMTLWVRGAQDAAASSQCQAKDAALCFTVPVRRTLDRVRPFLTFPDDGT